MGSNVGHTLREIKRGMSTLIELSGSARERHAGHIAFLEGVEWRHMSSSCKWTRIFSCEEALSVEKDERLIIKDCCRLRVLLRASLMNCLQVGASERKQLTAAMDDYKKLPS